MKDGSRGFVLVSLDDFVQIQDHAGLSSEGQRTVRDIALPFWLLWSAHVHRFEARMSEHVDIGGEG